MFATEYLMETLYSYSYKDIQQISKIDMDNYLNQHK